MKIEDLQPYQLAQVLAGGEFITNVAPWVREVIRLRAEVARRDDEIARLNREADRARFEQRLGL